MSEWVFPRFSLKYFCKQSCSNVWVDEEDILHQHERERNAPPLMAALFTCSRWSRCENSFSLKDVFRVFFSLLFFITYLVVRLYYNEPLGWEKQLFSALHMHVLAAVLTIVCLRCLLLPDTSPPFFPPTCLDDLKLLFNDFHTLLSLLFRCCVMEYEMKDNVSFLHSTRLSIVTFLHSPCFIELYR